MRTVIGCGLSRVAASDCDRAPSLGWSVLTCDASSGTDGHVETFQQLESLCTTTVSMVHASFATKLS